MLKHKLLSGEKTIGSWLTMPSLAISELMAKVGFDWLTIDLEHSSLSIEQAGEMIRIIDLAGVSPLVRLTSNDGNQIKRVMDSGAHGIIVPMVKTKGDAEQAVSSVYYPPKGIRGVGLARAQDYGIGFHEYRDWLEENAIIIVQIEHIDAVNNLKDILSVDGVDGYIIGPYDLSASLGVSGEFDHSSMIEAMNEIYRVATTLGKYGGIHIVEPDTDLLKQSVLEGFTFLAYSVDFRMLDVSARIGMKSFKEL
jgi:2-dehydro-3-deoxyglucarate aldolase